MKGYSTLYNNSYTSRKMIRLMEADGLEQIEANGGGNAGDFYASGRSFTPTTFLEPDRPAASDR